MKAVLFILLCSCAHFNIKQTAKFGFDTENVFQAAEELFAKNVKCSMPKDTPLTIEDADMAQLNFGRNIFRSYGVAFIQGLYVKEDHTIKVSVEHPYRDYVLFHEFLHFLFVESPDCSQFSDIDVQHKMIAYLEDIYLKATGRTREQVENGDWVLKVMEKYGLKFQKL